MINSSSEAIEVATSPLGKSSVPPPKRHSKLLRRVVAVSALLFVLVGLFVAYEISFYLPRMLVIRRLEAANCWVMRDHARDSDVLPNVYLEEVNTGTSRPIDDAIPPLEALERFPELKTLGVPGMTLEADDVRAISRLTRLKTLFLNSTSVSDEDIATLSSLKALVVLDLENTAISDAAIPHLGRLTSLQSLWLQNTQITQAGLRKLRVALPATEITGYIGTDAHREATRNLQRNGIHVHSYRDAACPQGIEVTIRPAEWRGAHGDIAALASLDRLDVLWIKGYGEIELPPLPKVGELSVRDHAQVLGRAFAHSGQDSPLREVDLECCPCPSGLLQNLGNFPHLEYIKLYAVSLAPEDLVDIQRSESLKKLHIYPNLAWKRNGWVKTEADSFATVRSANLLHRLYSFGEKFPNLQILILEDSRVTDEQLASLGICDKLEDVTVSCDLLSDHGFATLSECFPNVKSLKVSCPNISPTSLDSLASLKHLKEVRITCGHFSMEDMAEFSKHTEALVKWRTPTKFGPTEYPFSKGKSLPGVLY